MGKSEHRSEDAPASGPVSVGGCTKGPTSTRGTPRPPSARLSAHRIEWGVRASGIVGTAVATCGGASAIGRRLGLAGGDQVEHWADPEHPAAMTIRDVLAAGTTFGRIICNSLLAILSDESPESILSLERQVSQIVARCGHLLEHDDEARADGVLTEDELRGYVAHLRGIIGRCEALERAVLSQLTRNSRPSTP